MLSPAGGGEDMRICLLKERERKEKGARREAVLLPGRQDASLPRGRILIPEALANEVNQGPRPFVLCIFFFYLSTRSVLSLRNETHDKSSNTELHTCLFH